MPHLALPHRSSSDQGKQLHLSAAGGVPSTHPWEMKLDKKAPQDRFCNVMREVDAERLLDEQRLRVHTQAPVGSRPRVVWHSRPLWASHTSAAGDSGCRSQIHLPWRSPSSQSSFSRREGKGGAPLLGQPLPERPGQRLESGPASRFTSASLELTLPLTWLQHKRIKAYVR